MKLLILSTLLHFVLWASPLKNSKPSPFRLVFIGDSLTEGYSLEPEMAFPSLVGKKLVQEGFRVTIINAGVSGATSASALPTLTWQLKQKPDLIFLALGANDGLRGIRPKATHKNLSQAIELAQKEKIPIILAGMRMPPNYGKKFTKEFEEIFPQLAKKYGIPLVPFLLEGVAAKKEFNLPDGIHPNAQGYEVVARNVLSTIRSKIAELQKI